MNNRSHLAAKDKNELSYLAK